ncbi:glycosyltransferase family 2 protein [Flavobacteriaceae bacterium TK19130]|nr:glycosyltransferase family 2 protein [Thermobacterium salinum]
MEIAPLISVITPLYNAEHFIEDTIRSLQKQTHKNWEVCIVDDASTDTSNAIVTRLAAEDSRIRLHTETENRGAAYCRNKSTEMANGGFIAFLDADDLWHPEKLEKQLTFMMKKKSAVSYTNYLHMDETGTSFLKRVKALPVLSYRKQRTNNYIGNLTGMYNAEKLGKILAPNLRKRQDWAVWLTAIERSGAPAMGLQEDLAYYRLRSGSISENKWKLIPYNYQFYRSFLGFSTLKSTAYLLRFFWEYFIERPRQFERL